LSLRIYLDDCAYAKDLVLLLRSAGHEVVTPAESGTSGQDDEVHFRFAASRGLVLLTRNCHDFDVLHQANPHHPGILAVYQDNDRSRDMSYADIVRAIANLEAAAVELADGFHVLNVWRY
jgi:hypothetical protein